MTERFQEPTYPLADFNEPKERDDVSGNTPSEEDAMAKVIRWWGYDEDAKRQIELEFDQIRLLITDKHWQMDGPTGDPLRTEDEMLGRPNVVENVAFPLVEGVKAELSQDVELIDYPQEHRDDAAAKVMTRVKRHILYKNDFPTHYRRWLHYFAWYGTSVWGPRWDPEWKGGRGPNQWIGEIRAECVNPNLLYPDHRCGENIHDGMRVHKAMWKPLEHILQHYPERGHLVVDHTKLDALKARTEDAEAYQATAQEGMARLVETWYVGKPLFPSKDAQEDETEESEDALVEDGVMEGDSGEVADEDEAPADDDEEGLHVVWWIAEQNIYLAHRNFMYFEPGETPRFPFIFATCYEREDSPWGFGEGHKLIDPQQKLNKLSEIAMEGAALQALGYTLAEEEAVTPAQRREIELYGSIPGMWFFVKDPDRVKHITGQGVPGSVLSDITRRKQHMETVVGRFDISQGKTPSNVTAFRALNLLAERAQVRQRPKEGAVTQALVELSKWMSRLIMLHYNEPRAFRIVGDRPEDISFGMFQPMHMWRTWDRRTGNVFERDKYVPDEGMEEGRDFEHYWPEFDTRCEVTRAMSTDRYFHMDVAKEMVGGKLFPPSVLFSTMEHGRLPPWEEIKAEVEAQFAQAAPMGPQGQMQGPPQGQPQEATPESVLELLPPEQQQQIAALPPAQQQQVLEEIMAAVQGGAPGGA